jgi:tetratricopeptide (TPR) repeat protein
MEATGGDSEALGILYLIQGNAQKGIESLEKRGGEDSVTLLRAVLLGACYDMLGNSEMKKRHWSNLPHADEAALEALTEVLYASGPKQVGPHLVPLCKRAAGERPDDPTWHIIIGTIQETMEDRDAAIAAYTKALAMDPDNALIHFRLGGLYEEKGDYDAAVEHLQACLALDPRNAKACNYLGYMLAEQGANLDEAKTLIERALDIEPKNGYYLDSLGWVYYQEKEMEKAIEFLQLAVRHLDHDDAVVRDHLGDAHFAAGGIEQAIIQWRKALRLDPDNETIKEKLQRHQPETEPADMIR